MKYRLDKVTIYQRNQLLKKIIRGARGKRECFPIIRRNRLSRSMTRKNYELRNEKDYLKSLNALVEMNEIIREKEYANVKEAIKKKLS